MKKTVVTTLQVLVTLFILWLIFRDPDKRAEMGHALMTADWRWLAGSVAAFGAVVGAAILRWAVLLRVQGIRVPAGKVSALFMIGLFFNFLMPGGTGGDVAKIFYLIRQTPDRKAAAVLATLVDRIVGLFTLIVIAAIFIAWQYQAMMGSINPKAHSIFNGFILILASAVFGLVSSFVVIGFNLLDKLPASLPGRTMLLDLAVAYKEYGKAWQATLAAVGLSVIVHIASFFVFYLAARSLGLVPALGDFLSKMPVIQTLTALPLSVSGVGLREALFEMFFPAFPPARAALIGTCGFLATLVWGLFGGVVYLFYRPAGAPRLSEMEATVEAAERDLAREGGQS